MTMAIAIPTGVKVFNWLFTMFRGRIIFATPMLWFMGFLTTFILGGMTGVLMAIPGADFQLHNSLFLVAHFHNMIIGGVLFGFFAGLVYWFPKIFGYMLNERLGKYAFWSWLIGFLLAFLPLYALGLMGMTRRLNQVSPEFQPLLIVAAVGAAVIALGIFFQLLQLVVSIYQRKRNKAGPNPWNGKTLEWTLPSPPPFEPYDKHHNTPLGFGIAILAFLMGFGIVWHIWWLAALSLVAIVLSIIVRSFKNQSAT